MKRRILTLLLMAFAFSAVAQAQERAISGTIIDSDTKEPVMQTTLQLLKTDSTFIAGALSGEDGTFKIKAPENGKFLLRITNVGYPQMVKNITIKEDKDVDLGKINYKASSIMLKGATVTSHAAKVVVKKDTFIYNADAYRTPEGSVVEELVKKIPGATVDDDGNITINGKSVKKVLVDGKEFLNGDTKTALKNLPTSMIQKIKAYDEKSDMSKLTGIDDGNDQTVLDFNIRPGMKKGVFSNTDLGYGTEKRYSAKTMVARMHNDFQFMLFGSANNVGDKGFPGGGRGGPGGFGGGNGLNAAKMIAANFNYEKKNQLKLNVGLRWEHKDGDAESRSSVENFVSAAGAFSNSWNKSMTRSDSWRQNMRFEWQPDTLTKIHLRQEFSTSSSDSKSYSLSAAFSADPYQFVSDPLSDEGMEEMDRIDSIVNAKRNSGISFSRSSDLSSTLMVNRKLNNKGRSITLQLGGGFSDSKSKNLSLSDVTLYQVANYLGGDSTYQTNRWNLTPTKSWNYNLKGTWSEPLGHNMFLQASYQFQYKFNKSDRTTYDFSSLGSYVNGLPSYRGWDDYLNQFVTLDKPIDNYEDYDLSKYAEYTNYIHNMELMLRVIRQKYNFNIGFMVQPQRTHFVQDYQGVSVDTVRTVTNFSPTVDFRWRISDVSQLRFNYRGTSTQPSMTQLLDITDDSDPLNISKGNPGLKPAFTQSFRLHWNNYRQKYQQSMMAHLNFSTTSNSISSMVSYDSKTGGRTTMPENINGNWDISGAFMFNTSIDTAGYWNINSFTNASYKNSVSYLYVDSLMQTLKNTTKTTTLSERLSLSYRNDWIEVEPNGSLSYTHARNMLNSNSNLDTWQFSYGVDVNLTFPWGMSLTTDIHENSRRGYSDAAMNTNELVWNLQLGQSFLKGKPLTVTLQFYDILRQQSSISRTINSLMRSDTEYNKINSYAMVHVIYRMNAFGGMDQRRGGPGGNDRRGGRNRMGGGFGGPGGGGGRPPGGGGFGGPR